MSGSQDEAKTHICFRCPWGDPGVAFPLATALTYAVFMGAKPRLGEKVCIFPDREPSQPPSELSQALEITARPSL